VHLKLLTKKLLSSSADHREVYKKQSGGRGKFADIVFTIEPGDAENPGLIFENLKLKVVIFLKNIFHLLKKDLRML
jgi:translation elongation factor EF-G